MKEYCEKSIKIGFIKDPSKIFDEIEQVSADMIRKDWILCDTCVEDGLGQIHLFFERQKNTNEFQM